ncbi:adenylate cyclase type 10-like [Mustelus asterias]
MDYTATRHAVSFVRPLTRLKVGKQKSIFAGTYKICKLAANVPDLVVYEGVDRPIPDVEHFHGVLLFADISGFTSLTEIYTQNSKKGSGADHLTRTLNGYISEIVDHILRAGGDIVNYAGDAMLALWRERRKELSEILTLAVKCSLNIQDKCDNRETEVGVKLRVKIGISAGKLSKVVMGDEESRFYALIGRAVDEVRKAEGLASANTIILSPNAWELCDRENLVVEKIENERAVKVRYIKRDPHFSVEDYIKSFGTHLEYQEVGVGKRTIRKTSNLLPNVQLESVLRKYLLKTVLLKIDDAVPLEYLSEMRPATVVFVNLQFVENATMYHQCQSIQACCVGINNEFKVYRGRINKVFMFDKGCTFLCAFGLPGDKGEDECANALQCAHNVHEFCKKLRYVSVASIGVSSGPLFCGVVGHPLRHEYTVIGRKVNLAARLMMTYPGLVSCDEETHYHAKMPSSYFIELPKRAMKGVANPGTIYQYLSKKHQKILGKPRISVEKEEDYPLLGREKEMKIFHKALQKFSSVKTRRASDSYQVIMYEGTVGYGKSRLLAEIIRTSQSEGMRVLPFELGKMDITEPYYTIQTMMALLLQVNHCKSYAERERVLLSKITKPELIEDLCLLNDLLFVKFSVSEKVSLMDSRTKHRTFRNYVIAIVKQTIASDIGLLVIDQIQYIDTPSWELILQMRATLPLFMVMALRPFTLEKPPCQAAIMVMRSQRTLYVKLSGLDPSIIRPLACQILGVISIPRELETLLTERSYGVPYYCEEILRSLYYSDLILLEPLDEDDEDESDAVLTFNKKKMIMSPELNLQGRDARKKSKFVNLSGIEIQKCRKVIALDQNAYDNQQFICTIGETVNLQEITIPLTLKGIALAQLDRMNTTEQVIVKCASIIGHTFTTKMLRYILPEGAEQKLDQSLISLVKSRTFECASKTEEGFSSPMDDSEDTHLPQCFCVHNVESDDRTFDEEGEEKGEHLEMLRLKKLAKETNLVWKCKLMRFCIALVHETANDLWLKEQKKSLHTKCTKFLENAARKCNSCGEGDFIYQHRKMVKFSASENESTVQKRRDLYATASHVTFRNYSPDRESQQGNQNLQAPVEPNHKSSQQINLRLQPISDEDPFAGGPLLCSLGLSASAETQTAVDHNPRLGSGSLSGEHLTDYHSKDLYPSTSNRLLSDKSRSFIGTTVSRHSEQVPFIQSMQIPAGSHDLEFIEEMDAILKECEGNKTLYAKDCECKLIMDSVYCSLVRHWMGVGNVAKTFFYLLETAAAALYLSNNLMALSYLTEAENILTALRKGVPPFEYADITQNIKIFPFEKACLYSLKAEVQLSIGHLLEAEVLFKKSLTWLNKKFPSFVLSQLVAYGIENYKNSKRHREKEELTGSTESEISPDVHQQIRCLSFLWQIYCLQKYTCKLPAKFTILLEVNTAEISNNEFKIISAYIDSFRCYHFVGLKEKSAKMERLALRKCLVLTKNQEGLQMIGHLVCALSELKLCSGRLAESIEYGRLAHKIAGLINKPNIDVLIIPFLTKALLLTGRNTSREDYFVHWEKPVARQDPTFSAISPSPNQASQARQALSISNAGYALRPFDECLAFINGVIDDPVIKSEKNLLLVLHSSVALWYSRLSEWNKARPAYKMAKRLISYTNASLFSMYGYSKFLECQVLVFRKALWERQETVMEVYQQTKEYLREFKQRCNTCPVFYPRLFHLKAYCYMLAGQVGQANRLLQHALGFSNAHGNVLEQNWIKTSQEAWFNEDEEADPENLWVKAAKSMLSWNEVAGTTSNARYLLQPLSDIQDFDTNESEEPDKSDIDLEKVAHNRRKPHRTIRRLVCLNPLSAVKEVVHRISWTNAKQPVAPDAAKDDVKQQAGKSMNSETEELQPCLDERLLLAAFLLRECFRCLSGDFRQFMYREIQLHFTAISLHHSMEAAYVALLDEEQEE